MPNDSVISLNYVTPKNGESLCNWLENVDTLLAKLTEHLTVPADKVNKKAYFVTSATQPSKSDADKIWIKTSQPYGLGFFVGGEWQVAPAVPTGLIYALNGTQVTPQGFTQLTESEREAIGLQELTGGKWIKSN